MLFLVSFAFSQEKSTIHIYRPGQFFAAAINYTIYVNGEAKCKLSNNKWISFEIDPGKIEIMSRQSGVRLMKKTISVDIEVEPGNNYYFKADIKSSLTRTRMELTRVFPEQYEKDIEEGGMKLDNCQLDN